MLYRRSPYVVFLGPSLFISIIMKPTDIFFNLGKIDGSVDGGSNKARIGVRAPACLCYNSYVPHDISRVIVTRLI